MNIVTKIYLFEITDPYTCFRKLCNKCTFSVLKKKKKIKGAIKPQKIYFKDAALRNRIMDIFLY